MKFSRPIFAALLLAVGGCATQQPKEQSTILSSPQSQQMQDAEQGWRALQAWEKSEDLDQLVAAEHFLGAALAAQPDNIALQETYYSALYSLELFHNEQWDQRLEAHFQRMHPWVKANSAPPAMARYLLQTVNDVGVKERRASLILATQQQPAYLPAWTQLSRVLEQTDEHWLALEAARVAVERDAESAAAHHALGRAYANLVNYCDGNSALAQRGIAHLVKSVSLEPDSAEASADLALFYNRTGVFPLAFALAKKAYGLQQDDRIRGILADAHFHLRQYDEALALYQQISDGESGLWGLAYTAAAKGKWAESRTFLTRVMGKPGDDVYTTALDHWLAGLQGEPKPIDLSRVVANTPWELELVGFLSDQDADPYELIDDAQGECQASEAHFYAAQRWWEQGKFDAARTELEKLLKLRVTIFVEYGLAQAILSSGALAR